MNPILDFEYMKDMAELKALSNYSFNEEEREELDKRLKRCGL